MKVFRFAGTVLKSLGRTPATRLYPYAKRPAFARTRGHIAIAIDDCIFCGICDRRCPTQAIRVVKGIRTWSIERLRCIQCSSCVELCPKKCLSMETASTDPSFGSVRDYFTPTGSSDADAPAAPAAPAAPPAPASAKPADADAPAAPPAPASAKPADADAPAGPATSRDQ